GGRRVGHRARRARVDERVGAGNVGYGAGVQWGEADPVVRFVPEFRAVAPDPEPLWGGVQDHRAVIAGLGRIPGERHAGHGIDRADARAGDRARTGRVVPLGVVQPAL